MSVSSITMKRVYLCDGATTNFAYPFKIWEDGDLGVYLYTIADATTTTLRLNIDYTVNDAGEEAGGSIDLVVEEDGDSVFEEAPSSSYKLVVMRELDMTQDVDYTASGPFAAETNEKALDRLTYLLQQLDEKLNRCFMRDITQTGEIITDLDENWYILTRINLNDGYVSGNINMRGYLLENITGIWDDDQDTGVQVEESSDEDKVRFDTGGTQRGQFDGNGLTLEAGASVNEFSTDGTLSGNSDDALPTEKAVKTYTTINTLTEKTSLADNDLFLIEDSAASNARKKVLRSTIKKTQTFIGSGTFTAPTGVSVVFLTMCGGGGGGGGGEGGGTQKGGGGGAGSEHTLQLAYPVTAGNNYTVTIGAAGTAGAANGAGGSGGNTSFDSFTVSGGPGGAGGGAGGAGGSAASADTLDGGAGGGSGGTAGSRTYAGGDGGSGAAGVNGGGGGGSLGKGGVGAESGTANGSVGYWGGGGGGGLADGSSGNAGSAGGAGVCIVQW